MVMLSVRVRHSTGHATITPTVPIPEGNVTVKATDNAEHPNSSTSDPVKATDTTPPTVPTLDTDLGGKGYSNTYYGDDRSKYSC